MAKRTSIVEKRGVGDNSADKGMISAQRMVYGVVSWSLKAASKTNIIWTKDHPMPLCSLRLIGFWCSNCISKILCPDFISEINEEKKILHINVNDTNGRRSILVETLGPSSAVHPIAIGLSCNAATSANFHLTRTFSTLSPANYLTRAHTARVFPASLQLASAWQWQTHAGTTMFSLTPPVTNKLASSPPLLLLRCGNHIRDH